MNDIETLVRESMGYTGDLRPLSPEPLVRRARRRRLVRQTGTVGVLSAAAVAITTLTAYWPQPSIQSVIGDQTTSSPGGLEDTMKVALRVADSDQREAVQDNVVTRAEYRSGFDRYRACLSDEGYELVSVNDTGPVIDYSVAAEAADLGIEGPCYKRHFYVVDLVWQLAQKGQVP